MSRLVDIPPTGRIPLLIDSDAANEVDDQYALVLALLSPERLDLKGFVASMFDNDFGGPDSIDRSAQEIATLTSLLGVSGRYPIAKGGTAMVYQNVPSESEGSEMILAEARKADPDDPLWIAVLGTPTNVASAYLIDPSIAERIRVIFHIRSDWPVKSVNLNVRSDVRATRVLLQSDIPLVLFDTGTEITLPMDESERLIGSKGPVGAYLHEIRHRRPEWSRDRKGLYDLGDIAVLVDPAIGTWEEVERPLLNWDCTYRFPGWERKALRCLAVHVERTWSILSDALDRLPSDRNSGNLKNG